MLTFSLFSLHFQYSFMQSSCVLGLCRLFHIFWMLLPNNVKVTELNSGLRVCLLVSWLFWVQRLFETIFQSISSRLPETRYDCSPAPTVSTVGLCPMYDCPEFKVTQHHRLPPFSFVLRLFSFLLFVIYFDGTC